VDYQTTVTAHISPVKRILSNFPGAQPSSVPMEAQVKDQTFFSAYDCKSLKCTLM